MFRCSVHKFEGIGRYIGLGNISRNCHIDHASRKSRRKYFQRDDAHLYRKEFEKMGRLIQPDDFDDADAEGVYDDIHGQHDFTEIDPPAAIREKMNRDFKKSGEFIKKKIIERKYFNVKMPNILTYAAKQQIKYLNDEFPNEWTVDALSSIFPVDRMTIQKILRSNYTMSKERQEKHDEKVRETLESVRKDESNIDESRLNNFNGANHLPKPLVFYKGDEMERRQPGLFESIIKDYNDAVMKIEKPSGKNVDVLDNNVPNPRNLANGNNDSNSLLTDNIGESKTLKPPSRHARRLRYVKTVKDLKIKLLEEYNMRGTGKLS